MSATAAIAHGTPPRLIASAASRPHASMSHVTAFGVTRVPASTRVRCGEKRRMYSRPAQSSPLLRSKMLAGCVASRSSAIVGRDVRTDTAPHLLRAEVEVLEDRVAVGPRARRLHD